MSVDPNYPYAPEATDPSRPTRLMGQLTLEQSPVQALRKEIELLKGDPIGLIKGGYLKIRSGGTLVPFFPNKVQTQVLSEIQKTRAQRKPVRVAILKGRQFGTSTLSEAICYAFASQRAYTNSMVIADDQEGAEYLFEMCRTFHETLTQDFAYLAPLALKSSETKLEFKNKRSWVRVETAGKRRKLGRKFTLRVVHASEVAYWPEFESAHKSLSQAVPNKPETVVIYETTANGVNEFCRFWRNIKQLRERGETDWIPVFLSWKDHAHEYAKAFASGDDRTRFEQSLSLEERRILEKHGLSLEQMQWRRWKVNNEFAGDAQAFAVEYPLDDNEAFYSSGKTVFDDRSLRAQDAFVEPVKQKGEFEMVNRRPSWMPHPSGDVKIWEFAKPGHVYVIGADSSEVAAASDYACAQVIDWTMKRQVAQIHGRVAPDIFGEKLFALGAHYNWCKIVPEVNGPGVSTVDKLKSMGYPNLYRRKRMVITDYGGLEESEEFGWHTNAKTKPFLIDAGREALRRVSIVLRDAKTVEEMRTFVVKNVSEDGYVKYAAEEGFHDDRVMALLIALYSGREEPESVASASSQIRALPTRGY